MGLFNLDKLKEKAAELAITVVSTIDVVEKSAKEVANTAAVIKKTAVEELSHDENVMAVLNKTSDIASAVGDKSLKGLKVISGVSAYQDRKKSIATREEADSLKKEIETHSEEIRKDLNDTLNTFGRMRLEALHNTIGLFLMYLERMHQSAKDKEYDFLKEVNISQDEIKELKSIDMKASDAAKVLAVGGGFATIGLMGTPAAVTAAVTAFATASTGTAISSLSGAAASNAVLAWLGGGSIAAGGGGMAAGATVLAAATAAATAGLAVIAVGTLASGFYARKCTEAEKYLAEVSTWAEQTRASWVVMDGVKKRVLELQQLTAELEKKTKECLLDLGTYVNNFDGNNPEHVRVFQQAAIMVKSMSELAQTPILDNDGNLSEQSKLIEAKTEKVLNKNL